MKTLYTTVKVYIFQHFKKVLWRTNKDVSAW